MLSFFRYPRPSGQGAPSASLVERFAAFSAVTGLEQAVVDTLVRELLPGAVRDRSGSAVLVLGSGAPRRLVACPLDEPGWVVGSVQADGYLTLRRAPGRLPSPLFDQQLEGHRVTLFGRWGPVPGVVAVRSVHLTRGRDSGADDPFSVDDARVDVGAASADGSAGARVSTFSHRFRSRRSRCATAPTCWRHRWPGAARRAPRWCSRRARRSRRSGTVVVAFVTEQNLSQRGLRTVRLTQGPFTEELVVDGGSRRARGADGGEGGMAPPRGERDYAGGDGVAGRRRFTANAARSLDRGGAMKRLLMAAAADPAGSRRSAQQQPSLDDVRSVLAPLIETYGVSGMPRAPVRDAVSRMLPALGARQHRHAPATSS